MLLFFEIVIGLTFAALVLDVVAGILVAHRFRAAKFAHREDMSFEEIYNEYFQGTNISRSDAEALWLEAANALKIPPGKIRPTDSFDKELKYYIPLFPMIDLNDDFFHVTVIHEREKKIDHSILDRMKTLGEYIICFASVANR